MADYLHRRGNGSTEMFNKTIGVRGIIFSIMFLADTCLTELCSAGSWKALLSKGIDRCIRLRRWFFISFRQSHGNKKGYIYMLEVLIAVSIILVFITNIYLSAQSPKSSTLELIKRQGFEALEYLDKTGELRYFAYSGNEVLLESRLEALLPSSMSVNTDICTTTCTSTVPSSVAVVAVEYYISGYRDTFFAKKVKLWMWGSF
ncbi:hypothetical protein HYZ41_00140 [archaeon]|nr:hypothetical protein [archaeon]